MTRFDRPLMWRLWSGSLGGLKTTRLVDRENDNQKYNLKANIEPEANGQGLENL